MRMYLPLNALRAFEAASRHLSFTRAAQELCVTPTAVSHQIRSLEEFLGVTLFERSNGKLALTPAAAAAVAELSEGFNKLEGAMSPLNRRNGRRKVSVATSPSVASLWLLPKLQSFFDEAPDIDVSLSTVVDPNGFDDGGFDLAICRTRTHANRRVDVLMEEQVLPVCAPGLLPEGQRNRRDALRALPLIHDDKAIDKHPTWRRFFEVLKIEGRDPEAGLRFNQSSLAIEAAVKGHGLLLGRSRLIAEALSAGTLVPVVDRCHPDALPYYTVSQPGILAKPVKLFIDWLRAEVGREDARLQPAVGA